VRALVVANSMDADTGFVGERFRHHGYAFVECHRERIAEWPDPTGIDLVLLLGSEWSVYWDEVAGPVAAEAALVRSAHDRGVPLFGICFGSQMVSHALGGTVTRAARPEVGWHHVESDDPGNIAVGPWMQWHFDVFSVPPGFRELARSASGPQAIVHKRTFATQFHPEVTETIVSRWTAGDSGDLRRLGLDREHLMADTREAMVTSGPACERLVDWFVEAVAGA